MCNLSTLLEKNHHRAISWSISRWEIWVSSSVQKEKRLDDGWTNSSQLKKTTKKFCFKRGQISAAHEPITDMHRFHFLERFCSLRCGTESSACRHASSRKQKKIKIRLMKCEQTALIGWWGAWPRDQFVPEVWITWHISESSPEPSYCTCTHRRKLSLHCYYVWRSITTSSTAGILLQSTEAVTIATWETDVKSGTIDSPMTHLERSVL